MFNNSDIVFDTGSVHNCVSTLLTIVFSAAQRYCKMVQLKGIMFPAYELSRRKYPAIRCDDTIIAHCHLCYESLSSAMKMTVVTFLINKRNSLTHANECVSVKSVTTITIIYEINETHTHTFQRRTV